MIFKKIDRYVSWRFLAFLVGALCLLAFMYCSFDLLKRTEELTRDELRQKLGMLGSYYAYMVPNFLVDIVPSLILISAGMVMVQMARSRELLVLKACGISIYRVVAPVFFWTFLVSVVTFGFRQTLGPHFSRRQAMLDNQIEDKVETEMLLRDDAFHRKLFVGQYDFARQAMRNVSVMEFYADSDLRLRRVLNAETARWAADGTLLLEVVTAHDLDPAGMPMPRASDAPLAQVPLQTGLAPLDFLRASEQSAHEGLSMQTLTEIWEQMHSSPNVPDLRVAFHSRLASFFNPLILLLVGIPFLIGFEQSVRSRFLGVIVSIVVAGCFFVLTFVFTSMGATDTVDPVLAGWLPAVIGASTGLWLFQAMLT